MSPLCPPHAQRCPRRPDAGSGAGSPAAAPWTAPAPPGWARRSGCPQRRPLKQEVLSPWGAEVGLSSWLHLTEVSVPMGAPCAASYVSVAARVCTCEHVPLHTYVRVWLCVSVRTLAGVTELLQRSTGDLCLCGDLEPRASPCFPMCTRMSTHGHPYVCLCLSSSSSWVTCGHYGSCPGARLAQHCLHLAWCNLTDPQPWPWRWPLAGTDSPIGSPPMGELMLGSMGGQASPPPGWHRWSWCPA